MVLWPLGVTYIDVALLMAEFTSKLFIFAAFSAVLATWGKCCRGSAKEACSFSEVLTPYIFWVLLDSLTGGASRVMPELRPKLRVSELPGKT